MGENYQRPWIPEDKDVITRGAVTVISLPTTPLGLLWELRGEFAWEVLSTVPG